MGFRNTRGIGRELQVAEVLRDLGYLVASRRHEPGPGDHLAVYPGLGQHLSSRALFRYRPLLVETKGTVQVPWSAGGDCFGPDERAALIHAGLEWNVEPVLAWWPPSLRGGPIWLPVEDWPA